MLVAIIALTFFLIIALLLGYLFYTGKAGFLPSGIIWKESQVDTKKLMRFTGIFMFCTAFCVVLMMISVLTKIEILDTAAWILIVIFTTIFLIYGNGRHFLKYRHFDEESQEQNVSNHNLKRERLNPRRKKF